LYERVQVEGGLKLASENGMLLGVSAVIEKLVKRTCKAITLGRSARFNGRMVGCLRLLRPSVRDDRMLDIDEPLHCTADVEGQDVAVGSSGSQSSIARLWTRTRK